MFPDMYLSKSGAGPQCSAYLYLGITECRALTTYHIPSEIADGEQLKQLRRQSGIITVDTLPGM